MEAGQLLGELPNELTELIFAKISAPHLLSLRLISKNFDQLIYNSRVIWNIKMEEVQHYAEDDGSSPFDQYRKAYLCKKDEGKFSLEHSINADVDRNNMRRLLHGHVKKWTVGVVGLPRIIYPPSSPTRNVFGILVRVVSFAGNGQIGLVPFEDVEAGEPGLSLMDHARSYFYSYWGSFYHGRASGTRESVLALFQHANSMVELQLSLEKQQLGVRAWQDNSSAPPFEEIQSISMGKGIPYCWAVACGTSGSEYIVEKIWISP